MICYYSDAGIFNWCNTRRYSAPNQHLIFELEQGCFSLRKLFQNCWKLLHWHYNSMFLWEGRALPLNNNIPRRWIGTNGPVRWSPLCSKNLVVFQCFFWLNVNCVNLQLSFNVFQRFFNNSLWVTMKLKNKNTGTI